MRKLALVAFLIMIVCIPALGFAGNIDSPGNPSAGSGMYTLLQLYNYLNSGTVPSIITSFQEPSGGPGSTMKTTKNIYDDTKAKFDQCDAQASDVATGKKFFNPASGNWGVETGSGLISSGTAVVGDVLATKTFSNSSSAGLTGTIPTNTLSPANDTVSAGYYAATTLSAVDSDLTGANIVSGKTIFGKAGSAIAATGTAVVGDVLATKTFSNSSSAGLTGTIPTNTLSPANDTVSAGYYAATTLSAVDSDLTGANIVSGKTIFGKAGSAIAATGTAVVGDVLATKTFSNSSSAGLTGTIPTNTLSPANDTVSAGYYAATTLSAVDSDLASANIMSGKTIFGFLGNSNVVNTSSGNAAVGDIRTGKKAWVGGGEITGTGCAEVAKTGQITSDQTGDDGDLKKGVAWPNPRFTDNGNETVTDNLTGLMWSKNASPEAGGTGVKTASWTEALTYCNTLMLGTYNDWRLPNRFELESLLDMSQFNPALPSNHPFTDVNSGFYWSSTSNAEQTTSAWNVDLYNGSVNNYNDKFYSHYVWPVRTGQ